MSPSKLQLNNSSRPFKIKAIPQYQVDVFNQLEIKEEPFEEIIFAETPSDQSSITSAGEVDAEQKKNEWLDAPIKLLISLVKELLPQVGKTTRLKTKRKMWQIISEEMLENGYIYNAQQVETKYYTLERQYRKNKLHSSVTGRNRHTCLYQEELDELFQEKKCINPEYVLDEGESTVSTPDEDAPEENVPSTSKESIVNYKRKTPSKKTALQEVFLKKLDTLTEQTKEFEKNSLEILKSIAEVEQKREERAQREEERKKRKLELLETLVTKLFEK